MKWNRVLVALMAAALLMPAVASADAYLKTVTETEAMQMGGQTRPAQSDTSELWVSPTKAATILGSSQKVILDTDAGKFYFVKPDQKAYAEFPADMLGTMVDSIAGPDKAKADSIRTMMSQMMGDVTYVVEATDSTKKIGEWNTRKFNVIMTMPMGGKITAETWVTKDVKIDWGMYRAIMMQTLAFMPNADKIYQEARKLDGLSVETRMTTEMMGMTMKAVSRLLEFNADSKPPAGVYEVPADYTKSDNPMMFMGQ